MPAKTKTNAVSTTPVKRGRAAKPVAEPVEDFEDTEEVETEEGEDYEEADNGVGAVDPDALVFGELPARVRGMSGGRWAPIIEKLQANPMKWAVVGQYTSSANRPKPLLRAHIELATRATTSVNAQGKPLFDLWGRYNPEAFAEVVEDMEEDEG